MRFSNIFLLSTLTSYTFGSIIPINQERDGFVIRAGNAATTSKTSSSSKISSSTTSPTKASTTSSASIKASVSSSSSKVSSTSSSTKVADSTCTNSPFTRSCWSDGFSIATDFDQKFPTTGNTVYYNFEITNTTLAPDGKSRLVMAINNQYPGPTIIANWGDMISVTLKNSLQENGTGLHFHGMRQYHTNTEDGVPGITECPLAPGDTKTYTFQATQFGTSWYHSHFSGQYGDGVFGGILINGPATADYDIDLGTYTINDWSYRTTFALADIITNTPGLIPPMDTGLINGSMVSANGGKYTTNTLTSGKKYRLRLINTSVDNHFMVSLDNHTFQVIASDFVPIRPYTADWMFLGIGQRYDIIITANQNNGSYWFRAVVQDQAGCGTNNNNGNIKSIFTYTGATAGDPTSSATTYTQRCTDETGLVPYWDSFVPSGPLTNQTQELDVAISVGVTKTGSVVSWGVNLTALDVNWDVPILDYVATGNTSYPASSNLIELSVAGQWYYWIIQEVAGSPVTVNVPHPIHLHGHDFYVLGTGTGNFNASTDAANLEYTNPTRRDVAMLPSGGWLALAFQTDNPGAWVMHCHIAWHAGEGLAVQFLESKDQITTINPISSAWTKTCNNWNAWYPSKAYYLKDDSGI